MSPETTNVAGHLRERGRTRRPRKFSKAAQVTNTPIFASFLQAGFECSTHKLKNGKRLDLVASTQHDRFVDLDYSRLRDFGIQTVREGLRWHLIERERGRYDFSSALTILRAAQRHGIEIIWDVFHFGWPDFLDIFSAEWANALTDLAGEFGRLLRAESSGKRFVAAVNEISFVAWGGGDDAFINPFCKGRGHELKRQLVRSSVRASRALRSELPDVQLVSPEPVIHIVGDPARPDDVRSAEAYRTSMFEAWDMLTGRLHPELGGDESILDIIGVNFYDRNQWWNFGQTIHRGEPEYRPFREILREVYCRYRRPLFVAETGTENADRPDWFAYVWDEVQAAIAAGIPVHGVCLYPILNHPGWEDDRHCYNGLWDYAEPDGNRKVYDPLAEEIRRRTSKERSICYESKLRST